MFAETEQQPLIMVVDDDVFMRNMLQNLLEDHGHHVVQAKEGVEALEVFQRCFPDLVLMDAAMPVMDGFTACAELKKLDVGKTVPVIMITSLDDEVSVDRAFTAGAVEYITKPVHWAVLRHRVQVILQAQQAEAALIRSESRFRGIFEQSAMGIALLSMDGYLRTANSALQALLGQDETVLNSKPFTKFFYPFDTTLEKEFHQQLLAGERSFYQMEKYFFHKNQPMCWGRLTTSLVRDPDGVPQFIIQMVEDITERKRAQTKQRLAAKVFENTSDGVLLTNAEGRIIDANQSFLIMTGYSYEEILDQNPRFLKSGQHDAAFYDNLWHTARETGRWRGEIWNQRKSGELFPIWMSMSAVRGEHNEITHYVAVYSDLSSLKENDERVRLLTHYDALTELPNRLLFHERLTRACRQEERMALLYLDLDDFKRINEFYGYEIGDMFLKAMAKKLQQCIREGDSVCRLDGDEFGIILSPIHQDYDARLIADRIFEVLTQPVQIEEHRPQIDCNIGISFYPEPDTEERDEASLEVLIQHADMAMYLAKEAGKNTYFIYSDLAQES